VARRRPGRPSTSNGQVADRRRRRLSRLLDEFIEAPTWQASRHVLERHPELAGDEADELLGELGAAARADGDLEAAGVYEEYRELLRHCRAVGVARTFAELSHDGDDHGFEELRALVEGGSAALRRFWAGEDPDDLAAAVAAFDTAAARLVPASGGRSTVLNNLGLALSTRYGAFGGLDDLRRALAALERALALSPPDDEDRPGCLSNLGNALLARYQHDGQVADLSRALALLAEAAGTAPASSPDRAALLGNLGGAWHARYSHAGDPDDLERAVATLEKAVAVTPAGGPERPGRLANLGVALTERYSSLGQTRDLERAISMYDEAAGHASPEAHGHAAELSGLGTGLAERYARSGTGADLDRAVVALTRALERTPAGSPDRPGRLVNLGIVLRDRYLRGGDLQDLDQAVDLHRRAVDQTPAGSPDLPVHLDSLGASLRIRAARGGDRADLDAAVRAHEQAAATVPPRAPGLPAYLSNLGGALRARYGQTGDQADLDRAVASYRRARELLPSGAPDRAAVLGNLGSGLLDRHARGGGRDDLDQAILALEEAVERTQPGAPDLAGRLNNLANGLRERHALTGDPADLDRATRTYRDSCLSARAAGAQDGLVAAGNWGGWASRRGAWPEAVEAYGLGLEALERLYRVQLLRRHRETWLLAAEGLPLRAAYALAANGDPAAAAVTLERGRALLLSDALERDRADLEHLPAARQGLVERYRQAADQVDHLERAELARPRALVVPERRAAELRAAREELDAAIAEIRTVHGYRRFLEPPTFAGLAAAASPPVVYLAATEAGGLALLVGDDARARWLPRLTGAELRARVERYRAAYAAFRAAPAAGAEPWSAAVQAVTGWLWEVAMGPVLEAVAPATRAVLVPTGLLGLLPLHAAWTTDPAAPTGRRYALDELCCTYAPNARSRALAARRVPQLPAEPLLVVEEPHTARGPALPGAVLEAEAATAAFAPRVLPRLRDRDATRTAVLAQLGRAGVLHLACHGVADPDEPLDGGLVLAEDELLTLRDLLATRVDARLAVLSACESGLIGPELPDEVIGLPGGLLQAGVAGAVASLWLVPDEATMLLMTAFYRYWKRKGQEPAEALRSAQRWVRDASNRKLRRIAAAAVHGCSGWPPRAAAAALLEAVALEAPDERRFADPVGWAAFSHVGA
jgi:CHAT domain/Tetratricopeptide repeat